MKSLSEYIQSKQIFTVAGTRSKKILIFDVDDTLINTTANILVVKGGKITKTLNNVEFNKYKLGPGEKFDFREFDDEKILSGETFTPYWGTLKREYKKGTHISILTARSDSKMLRKFFLDNGIDIKPSLIFAISEPNSIYKGTIQQRKADVIKNLMDLGYETMVFFDDDEGNLSAAKSLERKYDVTIHTIKV